MSEALRFFGLCPRPWKLQRSPCDTGWGARGTSGSLRFRSRISVPVPRDLSRVYQSHNFLETAAALAQGCGVAAHHHFSVHGTPGVVETWCDRTFVRGGSRRPLQPSSEAIDSLRRFWQVKRVRHAGGRRRGLRKDSRGTRRETRKRSPGPPGSRPAPLSSMSIAASRGRAPRRTSDGHGDAERQPGAPDAKMTPNGTIHRCDTRTRSATILTDSAPAKFRDAA